MKHTININSEADFDIEKFLHTLDIPFELSLEGYDGTNTYYYFYRPGVSVSYFELSFNENGEFGVSIDGLASYDDYKLFPYLADCLCVYLNEKRLYPDGENSVYTLYNDDWIEESIGEEVALVKAALSVAPRYYPVLALQSCCISLEQLSQYAVNLHSSTPRIYGYIQYLMREDKIYKATEEMMKSDWALHSDEVMTDVPQHVSVGRVKSWHRDGSETWESFSQEDVDQLMQLAGKYREGIHVDGVVLNDIATVYQEGIGVKADLNEAAYWYMQAYRNGDKVFAPANLGDLYRKGGDSFPSSPVKAFEAYSLSEEPYAMYRIGQAYEEGWTGTVDMNKAMEYYNKSASAGHHLALKRLAK